MFLVGFIYYRFVIFQTIPKRTRKKEGMLRGS